MRKPFLFSAAASSVAVVATAAHADPIVGPLIVAAGVSAAAAPIVTNLIILAISIGTPLLPRARL